MTAHDPNRLGFWFSRHLVSERLTRADCAQQLGISEADLTRLALCLTPRSEVFARDLNAIAAFFGVDRTALANLIRQQQALAAWTAPPANTSSEARAADATGWLLAAHDADQARPFPRVPPHSEDQRQLPEDTPPASDVHDDRIVELPADSEPPDEPRHD